MPGYPVQRPQIRHQPNRNTKRGPMLRPVPHNRRNRHGKKEQ